MAEGGFALPLLALLFATWIFRPGFRNAKAGAKSGPAAWAGGLHHAANREAEDYYLQGRFYWNKRTPESLGQAVDSFTQAIVHDPTYSDAYVGSRLLQPPTRVHHDACKRSLSTRARSGEKGRGT